MTSTPEQVIANIREALEAGPYQGPWAVEEFQHDGRPCALIVSASGTIIAEIRGYTDSCGNGENARFISACNPQNIAVLLAALQSAADTPAPQTRLLGREAAIRKAGQVAIDAVIDGWTDRECFPTDDDLADHLTRIVDACVRAALAATATEDGR